VTPGDRIATPSATSVRIFVDGRELRVRADQSLAVALLNAGVRAFRKSPAGAPRAPVCGMGSCFECRVEVDGTTRRSCLEPVKADMRVDTARTS
jgi:sarcosine oxidase subunit alpha